MSVEHSVKSDSLAVPSTKRHLPADLRPDPLWSLQLSIINALAGFQG